MIEATESTVGVWKPGPKADVGSRVRTRNSTSRNGEFKAGPRNALAKKISNHVGPACNLLAPAGDACVPTSPGADIPLPTIFAAAINPGGDTRNWLLRALAATWRWIRQGLKSQQSKKRLRVCETVSLGEKRFVAVIQVDGEQFLVGGSSSSISTLAHLDRPREFSELLGNRYQQDLSQA